MVLLITTPRGFSLSALAVYDMSTRLYGFTYRRSGNGHEVLSTYKDTQSPLIFFNAETYARWSSDLYRGICITAADGQSRTMKNQYSGPTTEVSNIASATYPINHQLSTLATLHVWKYTRNDEHPARDRCRDSALDLRLPSFPPRIARGDHDLFATCVKASVPLHVIQPSHPHLLLDKSGLMKRKAWLPREGQADGDPFATCVKPSVAPGAGYLRRTPREKRFAQRRPIVRCASKTGPQSQNTRDGARQIQVPGLFLKSFGQHLHG
jgi:hypothetical protein